MDSTKIGILGCGNISAIYLKNCGLLKDIDVIAVADLDESRSQSRATEFEIPLSLTPQQLLQHSEIEIILNLTIPKVHAETCIGVLESGKHVYVEKPLAVNLLDGINLIERAHTLNRRVGAAPDTVLGGGLQTCRKLLDDGWIGQPIAATANMLCHGHEHWHPDPAFYYRQGGGPMFDMGPYYLTALISLIGSVTRVSGMNSQTFSQRIVTSQPKFGEVMKVEIPTHLASLLQFESGAIATVTMSFDTWSHNQPCLEIYGTEGSMSLPDPNTFGGPIKIKRGREKEWSEIPMSHGFADNMRGIGLADMAVAIQSERPHRASGEMALHVLEVMCAVHSSSETGKTVDILSRCERPQPMPMVTGPNSVRPG